MKQASLFSDGETAGAGQLAPAPVIARRSRPLTAAQKRFNSLLERVETLRADLERWQSFTDVHVRRIAMELAPRAAQLREQQTALAKLLDRQYTHPELGKRNRAPLRELLLELLTEMLEEEESPELLALYDRHAPVPRADEQRLGFELLQAMAQDLAVDLDGYDGEESPEAFGAWLGETLGEPPRRRRAGAAPQSGQPRKAAPESDAPALRSVFRRLASKLHPDRESDAAEQQRKTALMQQLNAAYASGDLLRVLELQHTVDARAAEALAELDDAQLKPYVNLLQRQAKALREQIDALVEPLCAAFPGRSPRSLTPQGLEREFQCALLELAHVERRIERDLQRFADIRQLRELLEEARREEPPGRRSRTRSRRR